MYLGKRAPEGHWDTQALKVLGHLDNLAFETLYLADADSFPIEQFLTETFASPYRLHVNLFGG